MNKLDQIIGLITIRNYMSSLVDIPVYREYRKPILVLDEKLKSLITDWETSNFDIESINNKSHDAIIKQLSNIYTLLDLSIPVKITNVEDPNFDKTLDDFKNGVFDKTQPEEPVSETEDKQKKATKKPRNALIKL